VPTTEYAGSLAITKFGSMMSGTSWKPFHSAPKILRNKDLPFRIWIDGQHQVRRLAIAVKFGGLSTRLTMNVTSINKPLTITAPPASEVSTAPVP